MRTIGLVVTAESFADEALLAALNSAFMDGDPGTLITVEPSEGDFGLRWVIGGDDEADVEEALPEDHGDQGLSERSD